jgi:hypothetical protein
MALLYSSEFYFMGFPVCTVLKVMW